VVIAATEGFRALANYNGEFGRVASVDGVAVGDRFQVSRFTYIG